MNVSELKNAVRKRDGYRCTRCRMTNNKHLTTYGKCLDVHRLTPGGPYTIDGCITICRSCHGPLPKSKRSVSRIVHLKLSQDVYDALLKACRQDRRSPPNGAKILIELQLAAYGFLKSALDPKTFFHRPVGRPSRVADSK